MAKCTYCGTPGAYIGATTVECRNPKCPHFVLEEKAICPCCGKDAHMPESGESSTNLSKGKYNWSEHWRNK